MSVTLSKSDISLTTPRTYTHTHTHTLSLSPVLYSSQTCQWLDPLHTKNQTMYGIDFNKHGRGHYRYDGSDRGKLDMLDLLLTRLWPVMLSTTHVAQFATTSRQIWYTLVKGRVCVRFVFLFCFFCIAVDTSGPVFCTTLLSPAWWIFYESGDVGFCVEDWNINMAVTPRAPLPALIQKLSWDWAHWASCCTNDALHVSPPLSDETL